MTIKEINDYTFYKIVCLDNSVELCYVGSTVNWKARNHQHKNDCNNVNGKGYNSKKYQIIRDNGGWCNFKMIEIGKKEQLTKRQADQVEEEYRQELKANMNAIRCYTTEEQKREQQKEIYKNYRDQNKAKILDYRQNYYKENRDLIIEKQREKVNCECGCIVSKSYISSHKKLQKHIKLMELKN